MNKQCLNPIIIGFIVLVFCFKNAYAEEGVNIQKIKIEFTQTTLSLKEVLKELNNIPKISVIHGNIDSLLNINVTFSAKELTIEKAISEIENVVPVEILFNNNHIVIKKKALSESYLIKGMVYDESNNESLAGAYVYVKGTQMASTTNGDGHYELTLPPGSYILECRFIGFEEINYNVNLYNDKTLDFSLPVKKHKIAEVSVHGSYTELENMERGRPIETIDAKTIDKINTNDVNDALHASLKGVWTAKVSGAPGDHHRVRIRGINSIFGCSDPLYVVDGSIIPIVNFENIGISDLNSYDVEKITVLKDASSTALYGNLGSNGVILIETKKGGGPTNFNFRVKQGVQSFSKRYPLMQAENFYNTLQMSDSINNTGFYTVNEIQKKYALYPYYTDSLGNTLDEDNFQDELFQMGRIQEYQLSSTGKVKTLNYFLSGNYYNHEGIISNTNYNKYTLTANVSKVIEDKFSLRFLYKGSHQENKNTLDNYMGNNVIFKGINYEPSYRVTEDSLLEKSNRLYYNDISSPSVATLSNHMTSPNDLIYGNNKIKKDNANAFNMQGFYKLSSSFSLRALMSITFRNQEYTSFIQKSQSTPYSPYNADNDILQSDYGIDNMLKSDENFIYFCQHYDLNYNKQYKRNFFNALIRYRNFQDNAFWEIDSTSNVFYDNIEPADDVFLRGSQAIYGEKGSVKRSINSAIITLNYNFSEKYFLSAISNFERIKENHYLKDPDYFYSMALSWNLAKENFIPTPKFIDAFNLNASMGKSGNFPLNGLADDIYTYRDKYISGGQEVSAVYISNLANSNLSQEDVLEMNFGAELKLFSNRLIFMGDYYEKYYSDLLIKRSIPYYYGGGIIYQNIGEMENTGLELSLEAIPFEGPNFYWNTRFGISKNQQKITKILDSTAISFNNQDILIPDFIAAENEVLGSIIGFNFVGKWNDSLHRAPEGEPQAYFEDAGLAYTKTDTSNMDALTDDDKTIIGNSIPDFTFHWSNTFTYKNFSIDMLWYGSIGVDKYNSTKASTFITGLNNEVRSIVLDSMNYQSSNIFYESSYFVEDASFIRLKTLTFSYRPNKKLVSKIGMEFSLSFQNLITFTRYSGYDPEATIYTQNNFTDNAIDKGAYPNPKGVFFSINLNF